MSDNEPNVERILEEALQCPAAERAAFLDEQCGDDAELRQVLLDLLKHHDEANTGEFLQSRPDLPVSEILQHADNERHAEANLLFGALAFQLEYIDLVQFSAVCRAWAADKSRPLPDLLVERGWIDEQAKAELLRLAERKRKRYGGDVHATLGAVADGAVRDAIKDVDDPNIQATISSLPPAAGYILTETITQPGTKKSRYTLTRLHAEGGLGQVWVAHDDQLQREVAFKQLRARQAAHPEAWRRFLKEAQVTGQLGHPNIVPVYELGRDDKDQPFYTMRLVEGQTLKHAIAEYHENRRAAEADPLAQRRLLDAFVSVCNAISYAHSRGVLHRDLKPQNVVLGGFGEVIVLDWGLAKLGDKEDQEAGTVNVSASAHVQATAAGEIMGTPAYMAPEQAAGRTDQIDVRTDVYGLGAILFEILTGRPPHQPAESEGTQNFLKRIATEDSPQPKSVNATVPRALNAICVKAMAKAPKDRYPDAKTLLDDVQHWLADEPVTAHPERFIEWLWRWFRKHRAWTLSVAASAGVVTMVALVSAILVNNEKLQQIQLRRVAETKTTEAQQARDAASRMAERESAARRRADAMSDKSEQLLYAVQIRAAQRAWDAGAVAEAWRNLNATRWDLRNWEHDFLLTQMTHGYEVIATDAFAVVGLAIRTDSQRIVFHDTNGSIWAYDAQAARPLSTARLGRNRPSAISADARRLARLENGKLQVWDLTGFAEGGGLSSVAEFPFEEDWSKVAISGNGEHVAVARSRDISIWDVPSRTQKDLRKAHDTQIEFVRLDADGRRLLVAAEDGTARLWDAPSGQQIATLDGHTDRVVCADLDGTDGHVATGSADGSAIVWDIATGTRLNTLKPAGGSVTMVAFDPHGDRVTTVASTGAVQIWGLPDGDLRQTYALQGLTRRTSSPCLISDDGEHLFAMGDRGRTIRRWHRTTEDANLTLHWTTKRAAFLEFSPDGESISFGIESWNSRTGEKVDRPARWYAEGWVLFDTRSNKVLTPSTTKGLAQPGTRPKTPELGLKQANAAL